MSVCALKNYSWSDQAILQALLTSSFLNYTILVPSNASWSLPADIYAQAGQRGCSTWPQGSAYTYKLTGPGPVFDFNVLKTWLVGVKERLAVGFSRNSVGRNSERSPYLCVHSFVWLMNFHTRTASVNANCACRIRSQVWNTSPHVFLFSGNFLFLKH